MKLINEFWLGNDRAATLLALPALVLCAIIVAALALSRDFFALGTETDYLGGFVPEAERLLRGGSLQLPYHPPFYASVIALVWAAVRDWFATGLVVSVLSSIGLVCVSYALFKRVWSGAAGLGAVLGLLASPIFLAYSALATSDVFFTFLYWSAFLLVTVGIERSNWQYWLAAGAVTGLVLLTRTNGFPLLLLLAAPVFATSAQETGRLKNLGVMGAGLAVVVAIWVSFALITDSRLTPEFTHGTLAQTYFAPEGERFTGPERRVLEREFSGVFDVLAHDPVHIAKSYVRDFVILVRRIFYHGQLLAFPLSHIALPGLLVLLLGTTSRVGLLMLTIAVLHVLLLNLVVFNARIFLFLAPLLGAAAGILLERIIELTKGRGTKIQLAAIVVLGVLVVAGIAESLRAAIPLLHADDKLLSAVAKAKPQVTSPATVVGFRPQVAYYLDAEFVLFAPRIKTPEELREFLQSARKEGPVYMSFGKYERARLHLPGVKEWQGTQGVPKWLKPVAQVPTEDWTLYEFQPRGTN